MTTDFSKQLSILGEFYQNYKDDVDLADFIDFNDLGLPLAYFASEGLCQVSDDGMRYIAETWDLFLVALEIKDEGFESLNQIFTKKEK
jgi:hypothetical protein